MSAIGKVSKRLLQFGYTRRLRVGDFAGM